MAFDRYWITARSHILESISNHGSSVDQFDSASSDPRRSAGGGPAPLQSLGRRTVVLLPQGKDGVGIRVEFPETFYQTGFYLKECLDSMGKTPSLFHFVCACLSVYPSLIGSLKHTLLAKQ